MGDQERTKLAVVGWPVEHSRSPGLHAIAYAALGLDWTYERMPVPAGALADTVAGLSDAWRGLSVTAPLKPEAAELADELDPLVELTGAANTLVFGDRVRAFNTDIGGIAATVAEVPIAPGRAVIFGAGATAASVLVAFASRGVDDVLVLLREPRRGRALQDLAADLGVRIELATPDAAEWLEDEFTLAANTVPAANGFPFHVPDPVLRRSAILEVSYDPWPTAAALAWYRGGGVVLPGAHMLAHQALLQVRAFLTGDPTLPFDGEARVREALLAAVADRSSVGG